jgi:hypothetical protein
MAAGNVRGVDGQRIDDAIYLDTEHVVVEPHPSPTPPTQTRSAPRDATRVQPVRADLSLAIMPMSVLVGIGSEGEERRQFVGEG